MIPLKIETLLKGRVVEHDRVEYKTGWNPNDIIHSICAFANDYDNTNGGYIVIGVKEENGMPVFPLEGVPKRIWIPSNRKFSVLQSDRSKIYSENGNH